MDRIERVRRRLSLAMSEKDISAADLARRIGRQVDYVRDFLNEKKITLGAAEITQIERILDMSPGELMAGFQDIKSEYLGSSEIPVFAAERLKAQDFFEDLPILSAIESGKGEMVVDRDPIEIVTKPWFLKNAKEGYGVMVAGESMEPVYEPGDIIIVNPKLPLVRGKDVLLICKEDEKGPFRAAIRRLMRWSLDEWTVRQINPPEGEPSEIKLDRKVWLRALRVVAKYDPG